MPRLASLGFFMRLGVVCLADLAVKQTTLQRRLLAMLYDEIISIINAALKLPLKQIKLNAHHVVQCQGIIRIGLLQQVLVSMSSSLQQKAAYLKSQGNSYFKAKDYLKAIESYTAAIRIDPAMLQSYSNRALSYLHLDKYEQALKDCDSVLGVNKNHIKCLARKGKCLTRLLRFDEAIQLIQNAQAVEKSPFFTECKVEASKIKTALEEYIKCRNQRKYLTGRHFLDEVTQVIKNNLQITICKMECTAALKKSEAVVLIKKFEGIFGQTHYLFWYMKTVLQLAHGSKIRAKRYFLETFRYYDAHPEQAEALVSVISMISFNKEWLLCFLDDINRAQTMYREALKLKENIKFRQAIKKFTEVIEIEALSFNERLDCIHQRGKCHRGLKERPKQFRDYNIVLRIDPLYAPCLKSRYRFYQSQKKYELSLADATTLNSLDTKYKDLLMRVSKKVNIQKEEKLGYYEVLYLNESATLEEIKKSYRELVIIYHPDKNRALEKDEQDYALSKFKELKKAYECLANPEKKAFYDQHGHDPDDEDDGSLLKNGGFDFMNIFKGFQEAQSYFKADNSNFTSHSGFNGNGPSFGASFPGQNPNFSNFGGANGPSFKAPNNGPGFGAGFDSPFGFGFGVNENGGFGQQPRNNPFFNGTFTF